VFRNSKERRTDHEERIRRLLRLHYGESGFRLGPARNPNGLADAISRYFEGELDAIEGLPMQTAGTPFQLDVWHALREVPCGTTVLYAQLAERIKNIEVFSAGCSTCNETIQA